MSESFEELASRLGHEKLAARSTDCLPIARRHPVHVVYGGAHLFTAKTPTKLGEIAIRSIENFAPDFVSFANAVWLPGADRLPPSDDIVRDLEFKIADDPEKAKAENPDAFFASSVFDRMTAKLGSEPVEDFRIDFEDGYGLRDDVEEDSHALSASAELAVLYFGPLLGAFRPPFCGFRVKSFQPETYRRAVRTLSLFLRNLLEKSGGRLPENFVVTLPKINRIEEIEVLVELLASLERESGLETGAIGVELMIETAFSVRNAGRLADAAGARIRSAHFGAFDYTAEFGIAAVHQHLRHDACRFARQIMQLELASRGVHLSDSVTTEMPVAIHRGHDLTSQQAAENKRAVTLAWRKHFNNVTSSLIDGFYQSWDLHPAQIPARYASVYSFFLESAREQGTRLKNFVERASKAILTGNTFDDAASAQGLLNFFARGIACRAISEEEARSMTGLTAAELASGSFAAILNKRAAGV